MPQADYRINWQMPASSPGPAIRHEEPARDPLREFETITDPEPELPDGIADGSEPGEYLARCVRCNEWGPLFCEIDEVPAVGYEHYCGGSPRCCP